MAEYIEREAAKKAIADSDLIPKYAENNCPVTDKIIDSIPAADVAPVRHGRWIHEETEGGFHNWSCSRCGRGMSNNPEGIDLYCYHCGAKMDGGADNGKTDV